MYGRVLIFNVRQIETISIHLTHMFDGFKRIDINRKREERNKAFKKGIKAFSKIKPHRIHHNLKKG